MIMKKEEYIGTHHIGKSYFEGEVERIVDKATKEIRKKITDLVYGEGKHYAKIFTDIEDEEILKRLRANKKVQKENK